MNGLRLYETLLIVDPRPTEDEVTQLLGRLQDTLKELGGQVQLVENWGKRRLTFDIKKQREGIYAVFEFLAEAAAVKEFERQLKLNEQILRFLTARVPVRKKARSAQPHAESSTEREQEPARSEQTGEVQ
ncbi:MAG: 30S ribosomal protein S6 [Candidatus Methylomirabilia bacterium]